MTVVSEIISVGTELLLGQIVNTNAAFLGQELATIGIFTYFTNVVGDNSIRLKETLHNALQRSDIVITTGGLGPTYDDLTKETVVELLGLKLQLDVHSLERITDFFRRFNRCMTDNNRKQAMMPEGAVVFDNDYGTAPAFAVKTDNNATYKNKIIIMLPGPPREMQPIYLEKVRPYLISQFSSNILHSKTFNIFGVGESAVETKLYDLMKNSTNPTIAPYAKMGEVELRVTALGANITECDAIMQPVVNQIHNVLGNAIYGVDAGSLQSTVVGLLCANKLTIATAESCTGGYIGKRITDIEGSSQVYIGGVVAYSNVVKQDILGVAAVTLEHYGAVSEQTAKEMAKGVAMKLGSTIGISTTGIATEVENSDKSVGLVFIGYYDKRTNINYAVELNLSRGYRDDRENIRYLASSNALFEAIKNIRE